MSNRIKALRIEKDMTLRQVADALGVSEATAQRYESGNIRNLKYDTMVNLSALFDVTPAYLMGWSNSRYDADSDFDVESASAYGPLWNHILEECDNDEEAAHEKYRVTKAIIEEEAQRGSSTPLYEAAAGEGRLNDGYPSENFKIQLEDEEFVVRVVGRSMEPTLQDGDIVIISAQNVIDYPRQIALVRVNGDEATLKRVEIQEKGLLLIGDNPSVYSPHFFTSEQVEQLPVMIEGVLTKLIREFD